MIDADRPTPTRRRPRAAADETGPDVAEVAPISPSTPSARSEPTLAFATSARLAGVLRPGSAELDLDFAQWQFGEKDLVALCHEQWPRTAYRAIRCSRM